MACADECSQDLVALALNSCVTTKMKGGFKRFAFMDCASDFDDVTGGLITDVSTWQSLIASNKIVLSPDLIASKGAPSFTKLRTSSCSPEEVVGQSDSYPFRSYNADLDAFAHITWWNQIFNQQRSLKFFAITCEGYVYGPLENGEWAIEVGEQREETQESPAFIGGQIITNRLGLILPVKVPGLIGII